jgi:hypothetical protein
MKTNYNSFYEIYEMLIFESTDLLSWDIAKIMWFLENTTWNNQGHGYIHANL